MKILVVDIETTGFLAAGGLIVELGAVSLDIDSGEREIVYDRIFNPGLKENDLKECWIVKNGYMAVDEILSGAKFSDEKKQIQNIVNGHNGVTAYNRNFDIPFLKYFGIKFHRLMPCPMLAATPVCKIPGKNGYKCPKVEEAYRYFFPKSEYNELHRGADDAMHEAEIIYALHKMRKYL